MKRICSESAIFRWICQNGSSGKGPSVPSSAASCHLRPAFAWTILPSVPASQEKLYQQILIKLIQLFFCVLDRHNRNSCLYTDSDYNRIFVFPPILQIWAFVIMTVDNTSGKPLFYSFSDVLSTTVFYPHDNKWNEKRLFVDNLFIRLIHIILQFWYFLFSAFCTGYIMRGVSFSSEIGWRATISSPCISIRYWSSVIAIASSAERGHRNAPLSSLLYIRRKPSPSQSSALIRSHLLPQKRNSVFLS